MKTSDQKLILCRNIKGGCGTTLTSINLACELSNSTLRKVLLIQLSRFPDLHCYLKTTKETSLFTLLNFINENKSEEGLEKSVQKTSNISFLPNSVSNPEEILNHKNLEKLIETIFSTYNTIIIDLDLSVPDNLVSHLISRCDMQLLFCNFDEASFAKTNNCIHSFDQQAREKSFTVINQSPDHQSTLNNKMRFTSENILGSLPYSPTEIIFNIMFKTPLQSQKRGSLKKAISRLSENIIHILKNEQ